MPYRSLPVLTAHVSWAICFAYPSREPELVAPYAAAKQWETCAVGVLHPYDGPSAKPPVLCDQRLVDSGRRFYHAVRRWQRCRREDTRLEAYQTARRIYLEIADYEPRKVGDYGELTADTA